MDILDIELLPEELELIAGGAARPQDDGGPLLCDSCGKSFSVMYEYGRCPFCSAKITGVSDLFS